MIQYGHLQTCVGKRGGRGDRIRPFADLCGGEGGQR